LGKKIVKDHMVVTNREDHEILHLKVRTQCRQEKFVLHGSICESICVPRYLTNINLFANRYFKSIVIWCFLEVAKCPCVATGNNNYSWKS
jgi:hypothetical protein